MGKNQVLRTVKDIDVKGRKILVRLDLDVPLVKSEIRNPKSEIGDDTRLVNTLATVKYLLDKEARVTIIGHLGRPEQRAENREQKAENRKQRVKWSVEPVKKWYEERLAGYRNWELWENLRFDIGEETNSQTFSEDIVRRSEAEVFVFEAFATAHQLHASIISVPKLVPETAVGFRFLAEIQNLSKIWQNPKRPVVFVLGGDKLSTKLPLVEKLCEAGDEVLLGGLFPSQTQSLNLKAQNYSSKLTIAELNSGETDISEKSSSEFATEILKAGTVVWNGPMGAFEKSSHKSEIRNHKSESQYINTPAYGTYIVAKAMRETGAFTVAGGGDTEAALTQLGGSKGIDWISSGGGAMLYYLAHHTLPFLEALK